MSRKQVADAAGATVGRVGEVRWLDASGTAPEKKTVVLLLFNGVKPAGPKATPKANDMKTEERAVAIVIAHGGVSPTSNGPGSGIGPGAFSSGAGHNLDGLLPSLILLLGHPIHELFISDLAVEFRDRGLNPRHGVRFGPPELIAGEMELVLPETMPLEPKLARLPTKPVEGWEHLLLTDPLVL